MHSGPESRRASMVDLGSVHTKLGALEEALRGLRAKQDCPLEAYRDDRDRQE
jgi:hypothetical protein